MEKIKILAFCDTPVVSTGFATVSRNILNRLYDTGKYDITVWGINHYGMPYDHVKYPYPIYPAPVAAEQEQDAYGRKAFLELVKEKDFDILWALNDPFTMRFLAQNIEKLKQLKASKGQNFKWVFYSSLDHAPIEDWVQILSSADYPIMWNEWAFKEVTKNRPELKHQFKTIYFGVDTKVFRPLSEEELGNFKVDYFGLPQSVKKDTFIVTNINRNQRRKDWLRTLIAFREFKKLRPNSMLYMHTSVADGRGNDHHLDKLADQVGLKPILDYCYPDQRLFLAGQDYQGLTTEELNKVYNISDVIISTANGEGVGLSSYEALAARRPIVMPDNTALSETMADGRGFPVKSGSKLGDFVASTRDNSLIRPAVDIEHMVEQLVYVHDHPEEAAKVAQRGYQWMIQKDWDIIFQEWDQLFQEIYDEMMVAKTKVGRNDPCYCGSGLKHKKCHGSYKPDISSEETIVAV